MPNGLLERQFSREFAPYDGALIGRRWLPSSYSGWLF